MTREHTCALLAALTLATGASAAPNSFTVYLDHESLSDAPSARLILFFITENGWYWDSREPMSGPFLAKAMPIASMQIDEPRSGMLIEFDPDDSTAATYPSSLDDLNGWARVQAVLDLDQTTRGHEKGTGNLYSEPVSFRFHPDAGVSVKIRVDQMVEAAAEPTDTSTLRWVKVRSTLLSDFYGRDVYHRAGVALPADRRDGEPLPAIYIVPGYGGTHLGAKRYGTMFAEGGDDLPRAAHIVLHPDSPLGHHGFVDSPNHGPRGRALVEELIPSLEATFNLLPDRDARIVTGHSSGGWSSLWLQLEHPDVFGACWSSAPDPVSFDAFQRSDLYTSDNLYVDDEGRPVPSMRRTRGGTETVMLSVAGECRMEWAVHPLGGSGEQWDAWEAMFSPRDAATGMPRPMFDAQTGVIDKSVVKHWATFDIRRRVEADWARYGPILMDRVHLVCGDKDSFYLNEAVDRLAQTVGELQRQHATPTGEGYIELVPDLDHGGMARQFSARRNREIQAWLSQRVPSRERP